MCFISIIVPTFNSEKDIVNCIESILKQSFLDYEILIQDGGSIDKTLDILSSFDDVRIKLVSEKDLGVYDAMNKAVLRSKGDWLYFLGSDDTLYSNNVLSVVVESLLITNAGVVYGNVKLVGDEGILKGDEDGFYRGVTPPEELFTDNICHQAIFYRSRLIKGNKLIYELKYPIQADHVLNIKMAAKFKFEYVPVTIANFQHGGLSSVVTDTNFVTDFGFILLDCYGLKLRHKKFYKFKSIIKKSSNTAFKRGDVLSSIKGYYAYLMLKLG